MTLIPEVGDDASTNKLRDDTNHAELVHLQIIIITVACKVPYSLIFFPTPIFKIFSSSKFPFPLLFPT